MGARAVGLTERQALALALAESRRAAVATQQPAQVQPGCLHASACSISGLPCGVLCAIDILCKLGPCVHSSAVVDLGTLSLIY